MVLYGIKLVPLAEEHMDENPTLISPFYAKDAAFHGLAMQSADQLHLLIDQGPDWGYFPNTAHSFLSLTTQRTERRQGRNSIGWVYI